MTTLGVRLQDPTSSIGHSNPTDDSDWGGAMDNWGDEALPGGAQQSSPSSNPLDFSDLGAALDELAPVTYDRSGELCNVSYSATPEAMSTPRAHLGRRATAWLGVVPESDVRLCPGHLRRA